MKVRCAIACDEATLLGGRLPLQTLAPFRETFKHRWRSVSSHHSASYRPHPRHENEPRLLWPQNGTQQRLKPDAGVDGVADPRPTEPCARARASRPSICPCCFVKKPAHLESELGVGAELPIVLDGTYQRRVNGNVGTWPQRQVLSTTSILRPLGNSMRCGGPSRGRSQG